MSLTAPNTWIHVRNGSAVAITVIVTTQSNSYRGPTVPDRMVSIAATSEAVISPIDPALHSDITQQASIGYSTVGTVTVGVFRL